MSIYKYESAKPVIARIVRVVKDSSWIGGSLLHFRDAIDQLGRSYTTHLKITPEDELLPISNHQVEIPCDLILLEKVECAGVRLMWNKDVSMNSLVCDTYTWYGNDGYPYYQIVGDKIRTSLDEGDLKLYYHTLKLDNDGFPYIPDIAEYRQALFFYIISRLILEGYKVPNMTFQLAEERWEYYKGLAKNKIKAPNKDQWERIAQLMTGLNISYTEPILIQGR